MGARKAFLVTALGVSFTVGGADLDFKDALRQYEKQRAIANQSQSAFKNSENEFRKDQETHLREVSRENTLRSSVSDQEREVRNLETQIARLESDLPSLEQDLRDRERQRTNEQHRQQLLQFEAQRAERAFRKDEQAVERAARELQAEESKPTPDPERVARLKQSKSEAESDLRLSRDFYSRAHSDLQRTTQRLQELDSEIRSIDSTLKDNRTKLARFNRSRQDQVFQMQAARDELRQQTETVRFAQNRMEDSRRQMTRAKSDFDREQTLAQEAYSYYTTVLANYEAEKNRTTSEARRIGAQDGDKEGSARGPLAGEQEGARVAQKLGFDTGKSEAKDRESRQGYRSGRSNPTQDPAQYAVGEKEGKNHATQKAKLEDFPRGYNDALNLTLSGTPANSESVLMPPVTTDPPAPEDTGNALTATPQAIGKLAGPSLPIPADPAYRIPSAPAANTNTVATDKRFYSPSCNSVALPEFRPLCENAYEAGYVGAVQAGYRRTFIASHDAAFKQEIQSAYDRGLGEAFPSEFQKSLSQGARDQGILDGFGQFLPTARSEQYTLGSAAWENTLSTGYLLRFQNASLEESSGDGLFTPGEDVLLALSIDNLGKKPVPANLLSAVPVEQKGLLADGAPRALPSLAGQTQTKVRGLLYAKALPSKAGADLRLGARLNRRSGLPLHQASATGTVHFPLELQSLKLAKVPKVDEEVEATVVFKNLLGEKSAPTPFRMGTSPVVAVVSGTPLEIPEIGSQEETSVAVKVKPGIWVGSSIEVPFRVETGIAAQEFPVRMEIDRHSSLILKDSMGAPVPSGVLVATAGTALRFQVQLQTHVRSPQVGPFTIRAASVSEATIRHSNNTTIGSEYRSPSFGTPYQPLTFSYDIPLALRGKSATALIGLSQAGKLIHVLQVGMDIR
jgi:hypothetical protein